MRRRSLEVRELGASIRLRRSDGPDHNHHILEWVVVCAAACAAMGAVALASRHGLGVSPDSVKYYSLASHFARTGSFLNFTGASSTDVPPGFPFMLAVLLKVGLSFTASSVCLNVVSTGLLVVAAYGIASTVSASSAVRITTAAIVALLPTLTQVNMMLWSEPPFAAAVAVALWALCRAVRLQRVTVPSAAVAVAATWVAFATRYVGIVLLPVIIVAVLLATRQEAASRRIKTSVLVIASALVVPVLVAAQNIHLGSGPLGAHAAGGESLGIALHQMLDLFGSSLISQGYAHAITAVGLGVVALTAIGTVRSFMGADHVAVVLSAFVFAYWLFVLYSETAVSLDPLGPRFLLPALVPMTVLAVWAVQWLTTLLLAIPHQQVRWLAGAGISIFVALLFVSAAYRTTNAVRASKNNLGYNSKTVTNSPLGLAVARIPGNAQVFASDPWYVYWASKRIPITGVTPNLAACDAACAQAWAQFLAKQLTNTRASYLAVVNGPTDAVVTPAVLRHRGVVVHLVREFDDGTLYRLYPRAKPS